MEPMTTDSLSVVQRMMLKLRHARGRALNVFNVLLAAVVFGVTTIGALAAPADAVVVVEDGQGEVYAAYEPSMVDRAFIGVTSMTTGGAVTTTAGPQPMVMAASGPALPAAAGACNPDDPNSWCYTPAPPPMSICARTAAFGNTDTETLPVHRWTDATSTLHSRLGARFYDDVMEKISRNGIQQGLMATGNMFWSTGVAMTEASAKFCIGDRVGRSLDSAMGSAARAVFFNAGVGMALVVIAGVGIFWRMSRTGVPDLARIGRLFAVAGLISAMIFGASNTTSTTYGTMSPGWMLDKVNGVLGSTSGMLSAQLLSAIENAGDSTGGSSLTPTQRYAVDNHWHCDHYVDILRSHYDYRYAIAGVTGMTAAPRALDSIWTESALQSYKTTQFGSENAYGDAVYCHQLELNAGTAGTDYARHLLDSMDQTYNPAVTHQNSHGRDVYNPRNNEMEDQVMVFWASCQKIGQGAGGSPSRWKIAPGWETVTADHGIPPRAITTQDCYDAYMSSGSYNWKGSPFNFTSADMILDGTTHNPATHYGSDNFNPRQFLMTYQGYNVGDGLVASGIHAIVGLIVMILFGLIGLVILIAKMAVVALMSLIFFVAMFDMLTGRASSRLVKFAKLLLGLSIVTWMAGFLLSFLAMMTKIINDMGRAMDLNVVGGIIWAGVAPILAVAIIKFVFDKVLKIPDPLSISGAKSYLGGAGAIGGATVDRVAQGGSQLSQSAWNRLTGTGEGGASAGGIRTGSSRGQLGGHSAGRGRDGAMAPDLPPQTNASPLESVPSAAGATAAGAAVGAAGAAAAARGAAPARRGGGAGGAAPAETTGTGAAATPAGRTSAARATDRAGNPIGQTGGSAARARRSLLRNEGHNLYGKDGENLPGEVAGTWGRVGAGREVQRKAWAREGRTIERQAIGGHSEEGAMGALGKVRNARKLQLAEREMARQGRRAGMSTSGKVADTAGDIGRKMTSGKVAAGAGAVMVGAATIGAGTALAATLAPAAAVAAAGVGTVAAARKLRDVKSGAHAARRAQRNDRSMRTFLAQREQQEEKRIDDEHGVNPQGGTAVVTSESGPSGAGTAGGAAWTSEGGPSGAGAAGAGFEGQGEGGDTDPGPGDDDTDPGGGGGGSSDGPVDDAGPVPSGASEPSQGSEAGGSEVYTEGGPVGGAEVDAPGQPHQQGEGAAVPDLDEAAPGDQGNQPSGAAEGGPELTDDVSHDDRPQQSSETEAGPGQESYATGPGLTGAAVGAGLAAGAAAATVGDSRVDAPGQPVEQDAGGEPQDDLEYGSPDARAADDSSGGPGYTDTSDVPEVDVETGGDSRADAPGRSDYPPSGQDTSSTYNATTPDLTGAGAGFVAGAAAETGGDSRVDAPGQPVERDGDDSDAGPVEAPVEDQGSVSPTETSPPSDNGGPAPDSSDTADGTTREAGPVLTGGDSRVDAPGQKTVEQARQSESTAVPATDGPRAENSSANQTPGPDGPPQGGDAAGPSGPGAHGHSRATARRDIWDHDGRPDHMVKAERDVFDHDGVDNEAMKARRDVWDHDGRQEEVVRAERDVFDHDGRRPQAVRARRDIWDHDGMADDASEEAFEEANEQRARRADARAVGRSSERRAHLAEQQQAQMSREDVSGQD